VSHEVGKILLLFHEKSAGRSVKLLLVRYWVVSWARRISWRMNVPSAGENAGFLLKRSDAWSNIFWWSKQDNIDLTNFYELEITRLVSTCYVWDYV